MTSRELFASRSPYEALKEPRRQRLLLSIVQVGFLTMAGIALLYGGVTIAAFSWGGLITTLVLLLILPVSLLSRWLALQNRTTLASYVFLLGVSLVVVTNTLNLQDVAIALVPAYLCIVLVASMLLGAAGGFVFAAIELFMWLGARLIITLDFFPQQMIPSPYDTLTTTLIGALSFFFVAAMGALMVRDLRRALDDATYELVQGNRQLEEASQLKSRFMARTSHELRTPLNSIIGFTDLSLRDVYGPMTELQYDGFRRVLANAKRLLALINDILDLSKIEAGELVLFEDPFPVGKLVETVDTVLKPAAVRKDLTLVMTVSDDMPERIIGDENRLSQILMNLVDNAVKYTDQGGINVDIAPGPDKTWSMKVKDTGLGIMEENFEEIFEEFRQLGDSSKAAQVKGTGLGLSITRHLTHIMGGEISVESQLGRGSEFTITLPLRVPEPSPSPNLVNT